jgi:hypothetical protein
MSRKPARNHAIRCPETSIKDYHSTLRYNPEEGTSHNTNQLGIIIPKRIDMNAQIPTLLYVSFLAVQGDCSHKQDHNMAKKFLLLCPDVCYYEMAADDRRVESSYEQ